MECQQYSIINSANLGRFYRYVNGKLSCKSGVGPLMSGSNKVTVSVVEKAELLNNYFSSVFTIDNGVFPSFVVELIMIISLVRLISSLQL